MGEKRDRHERGKARAPSSEGRARSFRPCTQCGKEFWVYDQTPSQGFQRCAFCVCKQVMTQIRSGTREPMRVIGAPYPASMFQVGM